MTIISAWPSAGVVGGTFLALLWLEHRFPLRRRVERTRPRLARNLVVATTNLVTVRLVELPAILPLTVHVERGGWGLLGHVALPAWLAVPVALLLLDYTLYIWHVLTHLVPFLWRFHVVHHVDLDLDVSTALRFHFGEIVISIAWRALQVVVIGVSPLALTIWQVVLLVSVLFHHSNLRLSVRAERCINRFVVTPRMHGIHHSIVREETNSNWSSGLTFWDWLHGTLRLNVPQEAITIGVPAYPTPSRVTLGRILVLPFVTQPPSWRRSDGVEPARPLLATPRARLVA